MNDEDATLFQQGSSTLSGRISHRRTDGITPKVPVERWVQVLPGRSITQPGLPGRQFIAGIYILVASLTPFYVARPQGRTITAGTPATPR